MKASIPAAIDAFIAGFSYMRCRTHPFVCETFGPLRVLRDAPRKNPKDYRTEEWLIHGIAAPEAVEIVREHHRWRYALCVIRSNDQAHEEVRDSYKRLGYRLGHSEPLMVHELTRIPKFDAPVTIERVTTTEQATRLAKAMRMRPIAGWTDPKSPIRQYLALDGKEIVGWVSSIRAGKAAWVSNMYVRPTHRRRGIGKAMLSQMLRDDRKAGVQQSVLLASHTGAMLYPVVGYEQIGMLLLFTPSPGTPGEGRGEGS